MRFKREAVKNNARFAVHDCSRRKPWAYLWVQPPCVATFW